MYLKVRGLSGRERYSTRTAQKHINGNATFGLLIVGEVAGGMVLSPRSITYLKPSSEGLKPSTAMPKAELITAAGAHYYSV